MDFFKNFSIALINPKKYSKLLNVKHSFTLIYVLIVMLISFSTYIFGFGTIYKNAGVYYEQVVPEFTFKNCTLDISEPFRLELMGQIIYADTTKELTTKDFGDNIQGILFDADSMILRQANKDTQVMYNELILNDSVSFSKNDIKVFTPQLKLIFILFCAFTLLILAGGFFLSTLVVALLSKLPNMSVNLSFSKLYKLAMFSRGLPVILSCILTFFLSGMPLIASILISCIMMNISLTTITKNKEI